MNIDGFSSTGPWCVASRMTSYSVFSSLFFLLRILKQFFISRAEDGTRWLSLPDPSALPKLPMLCTLRECTPAWLLCKDAKMKKSALISLSM